MQAMPFLRPIQKYSEPLIGWNMISYNINFHRKYAEKFIMWTIHQLAHNNTPYQSIY